MSTGEDRRAAPSAADRGQLRLVISIAKKYTNRGLQSST